MLFPPPPLSVSVGGESLAVAQNTYAVNWFKGKELNLVFGLQLSMARLVRTPFILSLYLYCIPVKAKFSHIVDAYSGSAWSHLLSEQSHSLSN